MTAAIGVVGVGVVTVPALIVAGLPVSGSLAFGLAWTVSGLAFAGVGAVAAHLRQAPERLECLAVIALAVDICCEPPATPSEDRSQRGRVGCPDWLGPQIRPYAGDRWALAILLIAFGGVMVALASRGTRPAGWPRSSCSA